MNLFWQFGFVKKIKRGIVLVLTFASLVFLFQNFYNAPSATILGDSVNNKSIQVSGSVMLDPSVVYSNVTFLIIKSNTSIDCKGATLNNSFIGFKPIELKEYVPYNLIGKQSELIEYLKNNILVAELVKKELIENKIQDVLIKNCNFKDNNHTPIFLDNQNPNLTVRNLGLGMTLKEMQKSALKNITIENVHINTSGSGGIFVGAHSLGTIIKDTTIENVGAMAIYLELGSGNTIIKDSKFINNGHIAKREAISIDSSTGNFVERNYFENNYGGSIQTYKNCVERFSDKEIIPNYYPRDQHSSYNIIRYNHFKNEKTAVWIASRQDANAINWDCEEKPIFVNKAAHLKIQADYSSMNFIYGNKIETNVPNAVGIRLSDNNNLILANQFQGAGQKSIFLISSSKSRKYFDSRKSLTGNTIINNKIISTGSKMYLFGWDSTGIACNNYLLNSNNPDRSCQDRHYELSEVFQYWNLHYKYMQNFLIPL